MFVMFQFFHSQLDVPCFWLILIITWQFFWFSFQVLYGFKYKSKYYDNSCRASIISVQQIVWKETTLPDLIWNMPSLIIDFFTVIIFYEECIYLPHMCFRVDYVTLGCFSFAMLIDLHFWFWTDLVGKSFWSFII